MCQLATVSDSTWSSCAGAAQALMDSEDWDPDAYDAAMQSAFGEDYYEVRVGKYLCDGRHDVDVAVACHTSVDCLSFVMLAGVDVTAVCQPLRLWIVQAADEMGEGEEGDGGEYDEAQPVGRDQPGV